MTVKVQSEKNADVRNRLSGELKLHKLNAKAFYREIQRCRKLAKDTDDVEMITFDYEQNLPVPITNVTDEFYLGQMWVYIFGVHKMSDNKQVMYMYNENTAKKRCSEVVSLLKHLIENDISRNVKKLYVFSDGCTGQNRNHTLVDVFFSLMQEGRLNIDQRYPVIGHSYLPNDRGFVKIEVQKKQV